MVTVFACLDALGEIVVVVSIRKARKVTRLYDIFLGGADVGELVDEDVCPDVFHATNERN